MREIFDYKILVLSSILLLANILFVNSLSVMAFLSIMECALALFFLFFQKIKQFLILLLVCTTTSFDVPAFFLDKEGSYSISNIPLLGFTGFSSLIILALLVCMFKHRYRFLHKNIFTKFSLYVTTGGLIMSILCLVVNDNNIGQEDFWMFFKSDFAKYFIICLIAILFQFVLSNDSSFLQELKKSIFTLLTVLILGSVISILLGKWGHYGNEDIILIPLSFIYNFAIILFLFDNQYRKYRKLIIGLSFISVIVQISFANALSGKSWLAFVLVCLFCMYRTYKKGYKLFSVFTGVVIIVFLVFILNSFASKDNLIGKKVQEAISLFSITNSQSYYETMSASPKARIDEFINIIEEYKEKPQYLLCGKGLGGSVKDHKKLFGSFVSSNFSDKEYSDNAFVFLHESINVVFLKFGITGLCFIFCIAFKIIKNGFASPYTFVGFVYIIFFFGYTIGLNVFGVSALTLSLYELELQTRGSCK